MTNLKFTIEYDGSGFSGFQSQPEVRTVQDCFESALRSITGCRIRVQAAGRTDTGVHAEGQVISCPYRGPLSVDTLKRALNARLPLDLSVVMAEQVPLGFDPRRDASARTYEYRILNREERSALGCRQALWVPQGLDLPLMRKASEICIGQYDFRHFATSESGFVPREIFECVCWREGDKVLIGLRANAFAKRMARRIAGALLQVGLRRWGSQVVAELLSGMPTRFVAPSLPPHGLYLTGVEYDSRVEFGTRGQLSAGVMVSGNA